MPAFLAGLAALLFLIFGARLLASANPQKLAAGMRMAGGVALLLVAAFLLVRGALPLAIPLVLFGFALLRLPLGSWFGSSGPLSSLSDGELLLLLAELRDTDAQGAALIEAYLDRRAQGWREKRGDDAAKERARAPRGGRIRMAPDEAYAVLGLGKGASEGEIRAAHRKLMMKLHPDQGGSTYLAARINEAKDVLLGRK
jgi:DnaJ domain